MTPRVDHPRLIVFSGPSGAGKTTIARRLLDDPRFGRAVTATTRAPRGDEQDGRDYHFLTRRAFHEALRAGRFLEHADVYGDLYGTPRDNVRAVLDSGRHCLLVVDVQGVDNLKGSKLEDLHGPDTKVLYVFVKAPSMKELEARLRGRGNDAATSIEARLEASAVEMEKEGGYDVVLVNDDIERAARELADHIGVGLAEAGSEGSS